MIDGAFRTHDECLEIAREVAEAMIAHCVREAPLECCGILGGMPPRASSFHPLRNELASETCYRADAQDLIKAIVELRGRALELIAIYHSHPRWQAVPSRTDLRENYYGTIPRIIVSLLNDPPEVRIWRLDTDSYEELAWRLVESTIADARA